MCARKRASYVCPREARKPTGADCNYTTDAQMRKAAASITADQNCIKGISGAVLTFGVLARGLRSRGLRPSPAHGWRGRGRRGAVGGQHYSIAWGSVT